MASPDAEMMDTPPETVSHARARAHHLDDPQFTPRRGSSASLGELRSSSVPHRQELASSIEAQIIDELSGRTIKNVPDLLGNFLSRECRCVDSRVHSAREGQCNAQLALIKLWQSTGQPMPQASAKVSEAEMQELLARVNPFFSSNQMEIGQTIDSPHTQAAKSRKLRCTIERGQTIRSDRSESKPDVCTTAITSQAGAKTTWRAVEVIGELKRTGYKSSNDLAAQLGRYARESLAAHPVSSVVHAFSVEGCNFRSWIFDRSGCIKGESFNVFKEFGRFLEHMWLYATMSEDELCRPAANHYGLQPSNSSEAGGLDTAEARLYAYDASNSALDTGDQLVFLRSTKDKPDYIRRSIVGRATYVERVSPTDASGRVAEGQAQLMAKWAWVPVEYRHERETYRLTQGVSGTPRLIAYCDRPSISDHRKRLKLTQEMLEHNDSEASGHSLPYQDRQQRLFVMEDAGPSYRKSIDRFSQWSRDTLSAKRLGCEAAVKYEEAKLLVHLVGGLRDQFVTINDLWEAGVLHQDLSPDNVTLRDGTEALRRFNDLSDDESKSAWCGFSKIFDFDMSRSVEEVRLRQRTGALSRTGTQLYMAVDLLLDPNPSRPGQQNYRTDAESAFWIYVLSLNRLGVLTGRSIDSMTTDSLRMLVYAKTACVNLWSTFKAQDAPLQAGGIRGGDTSLVWLEHSLEQLTKLVFGRLLLGESPIYPDVLKEQLTDARKRFPQESNLALEELVRKEFLHGLVEHCNATLRDAVLAADSLSRNLSEEARRLSDSFSAFSKPDDAAGGAGGGGARRLTGYDAQHDSKTTRGAATTSPPVPSKLSISSSHPTNKAQADGRPKTAGNEQNKSLGHHPMTLRPRTAGS